MSVSYGFYNAIQDEETGVWDRSYNAEQMSRLFDGLINDGVYETIGNKFKVSPLSGMTITVGTGRAWFDHTWTLNDALITITLNPSHASYDRIDAIVIQTDSSSRVNSIIVKPGNPAPTPARPSLTTTQHPIAYVTVPARATAIKASNITNMVGTSSCPFVTGVVSVMNIDQMIAQWEDQWNTWLTENQDAFNTDIAELMANTQALIDHLADEIDEIEHETGADIRPVIEYDISVDAENWEQFEAEDSQEEAIFAAGYIYRSKIYINDVIPAMRPYITWDLQTVYSSKADLLNECQCTYGGVYIYSRNIPSYNIYALTVECRNP